MSEPENNKADKRRAVGRPRKVKLADVKEERINKNEKLGPKMAAEKLAKILSEEYSTIGIYGIDSYTTALIDVLWGDPSMAIVATDINPSRLDNINRLISQRSFSMYRWEAIPPTGFIEDPICDIIIVAKDAVKEARSKPNKYKIEIVVMEDLAYEQ